MRRILLILALFAGLTSAADRPILVLSGTGQYQPLASGDAYIFRDAANAVLGTGTGTKWGTSASQKQSWYNATPVIQQTGDVATALVTYGLMTSPTIVATTAIDSTFRVLGSSDATKKLAFEVDAQTAGKVLTIDTGAQTLDRTLSVPVLAGADTIATLATANAFTATQTVTASGALLHRQASTQDGISLLGRAGGTSSYSVSLTPTTLTASRTVTLPDAAIIVSGSASALTSGRVPYATTGGLLLDSANLTFDGTNFAHGGSGTFATGTGAVSLNGSTTIPTGKTLTVTDLTTGRVTYSSTAGLQVNSSNLTFDGTNFAHGGSGTFATGTGAVSLNGATTVVSGKQFNAADATTSTSTSTGAIITAGGLGVAKDFYVGSGSANTFTVYVQGNGGTNLVGMGGGADAKIGGYTAALAAANLTIQGNGGALTVGTTATVATFAGTTDATSTSTGTITTPGGISCAKALWVGGLTNIAGAVTISGTSLSLTAATSLLKLNRATDGNPGELQFLNAGGTKYNWQVAVQYNSDNAFEITPSTAAGGSTYSSPAISIAAATGLVSVGGALTVTGITTLNGTSLAVNSTSAAGFTVTSATTNAVVNMNDFRVNSSGTAAAGFGGGLTMRAESSTTDNTIQFEMDSVWVVATHASRTARTVLYSQDSGGSRECMRLEASGTAAMIGFLGANAVVRPSTSGEATGFTAGAGTTATSTSTWTGNVGSTAYTTNDIVKHLKNLGLIAQ